MYVGKNLPSSYCQISNISPYLKAPYICQPTTLKQSLYVSQADFRIAADNEMSIEKVSLVDNAYIDKYRHSDSFFSLRYTNYYTIFLMLNYYLCR